MNKKNAIGVGVAFVVFVASYYAGILLLRFLSGVPEVSAALVLAIADLARMVGPIVGGYIVGRTLARRGMLAGLLFSLTGLIVLESIGHEPWYYEYDYFQDILALFATHYAIPGALAGGCGELHSRRVLAETSR